jgi:hypothetical protein
MGEFLSTPIRDKVSEDNENSLVNINLNRLDKIWCMWHARLEKKNGGLTH